MAGLKALGISLGNLKDDPAFSVEFVVTYELVTCIVSGVLFIVSAVGLFFTARPMFDYMSKPISRKKKPEEDERTRDQGEVIRRFKWAALYLLLFVVGGWLAVGLYPTLVYDRVGCSNEIGDTFGVVNALFSALAFGGVLFTILLQSLELRFQREEMSEARDVQEDISRSAHISAYAAVANCEIQILRDRGMTDEIDKILSTLRIIRDDITLSITDDPNDINKGFARLKARDLISWLSDYRRLIPEVRAGRTLERKTFQAYCANGLRLIKASKGRLEMIKGYIVDDAIRGEIDALIASLDNNYILGVRRYWHELENSPEPRISITEDHRSAIESARQGLQEVIDLSQRIEGMP